MRTERRVLVGRDDTQSRMYVTVGLETSDKSSGYALETVNHEQAGQVTRLSMVGEVFEYGQREASMAGQITDHLLSVEPNSEFDAATLKDMHDTWERWHLNDMKAGCAHQTVVWEIGRYGNHQPSLDHTPRCPITGYRYGFAWLYDPMPEDVLNKVRTFIETGEWKVESND